MQAISTTLPNFVMPHPALSIVKHFEILTDPRQPGNIEYKLIEIIVITICAVICRADSWVEVLEFGKERNNWLCGFSSFT